MEINKIFTDIEKFFNIAASIPIVAIFSSLLRNTASKIQMIAGAIIGLAGLIAQIVSPSTRKWEEVARQGGEQLLHGVLNSIRAFGELLLATTIVGSLIPLVYQMNCENKFAPIIKYSEPNQNPTPK